MSEACSIHVGTLEVGSRHRWSEHGGGERRGTVPLDCDWRGASLALAGERAQSRSPHTPLKFRVLMVQVRRMYMQRLSRKQPLAVGFESFIGILCALVLRYTLAPNPTSQPSFLHPLPAPEGVTAQPTVQPTTAHLKKQKRREHRSKRRDEAKTRKNFGRQYTPLHPFPPDS